MIINQVAGGGGLKAPSNGKELTGVSFASSLQKGDFVTISSGQFAMPGVGVDFRPGNANEDYHTSSNCYFLYNSTKYPSLGSCWLTPTTGFGICKVQGTSKPYTQTVLFYKSTFTDKMTVEWSTDPVLTLSLENSVGMSILGLVPLNEQYLLLIYDTGVDNNYSSDVQYWAIKTLKWNGTSLTLASSWRGTENYVSVPSSYILSSGYAYLYLYQNSSGGFYLIMMRYVPDGENSSMSWSDERQLFVFSLSSTGVVQSFAAAPSDINISSYAFDWNELAMAVDEENDKIYINFYQRQNAGALGSFFSIYDIKAKTLTNPTYNDRNNGFYTLTSNRFLYIKGGYLYRYFTDRSFGDVSIGIYNYSSTTTPDLSNPIAKVAFVLPNGISKLWCSGIYVEDNEHIYFLMSEEAYYSSSTNNSGAIYLYRYSFNGTKITQVGDPLLLCETKKFLDEPLLNMKKINDAFVLNSYYLNTKLHFISPETPSVLGIKKNDTTAIVVAKE